VDLLRLLPTGPLHGLLDDNAALAGTAIDEVRVLGPLRLLATLCQAKPMLHVALAIGDNAARRRVARQVSRLGFTCPPLVHPAAVVSSAALIGLGSVVCAGSFVGPGSTVGTAVIINTHAAVDHDCRLEDFVHIGPGATLAGGVCVGSGTLVGAGATVIPGIRIGRRCIIGAGATVIHDVPAGQTVVGCPARPVRQRC